MGNVLPPPSTNVPIVQDLKEPKRRIDLTPPWRRFFVDLVELLNKSGGTLGSIPASRTINTAAPLVGGGELSADLDLDFEPEGIDGDVQINDGGALGAITGIDATITTAKITPGGADGSMTFVNGILTAQTQAT